jgi:nucleoid-associated protein YgaU
MAKKTTKNNFDVKQLLDNSGSYKNLIYGAVTVLILAVIVFLGIRTLSQNKGDINDDAITVEEETVTDYEVVEGDTLWSISEKVYGTGFNWQMLAEANNIADPDNLEAGTKLTIPVLTPAVAEKPEEVTEEEASEPTKAPAEEEKVDEKITSSATEYTVVAGDSLWKIAVAQYNDGYKWVEIARANKLANPDLIHPGNKFVLPR